MTPFFLWVTVLMYSGAALNLYHQGKVGLTIMFLAYAVGNIGAIMAARGI